MMKPLIAAIALLGAYTSWAADSNKLLLTDRESTKLHMSGDDAVLEVVGQAPRAYQKAKASLGGANVQLRAKSPGVKPSTLSLHRQPDGSYLCEECSAIPIRLERLPAKR